MTAGTIHIMGQAGAGTGGWRHLDDAGRLTVEAPGADECCPGEEWQPYGAMCTLVVPLLWPCSAQIDGCVSCTATNFLPSSPPSWGVSVPNGFSGGLVTAVAVKDGVADPVAQAISFIEGENQPIEDICPGIPSGWATWPIAFGIGGYLTASMPACGYIDDPEGPLKFVAKYTLVWYATRWNDYVVTRRGFVCCPSSESCENVMRSTIADYDRAHYRADETAPDYVIWGSTQMLVVVTCPPIAPWPSGGMSDPASNIDWPNSELSATVPCPTFGESRRAAVFGGETRCNGILLPHAATMGGELIGGAGAWPYAGEDPSGTYRYRKVVTASATWSGYREPDPEPHDPCVDEVPYPDDWNVTLTDTANIDMLVKNVWGAP